MGGRSTRPPRLVGQGNGAPSGLLTSSSFHSFGPRRPHRGATHGVGEVASGLLPHKSDPRRRDRLRRWARLCRRCGLQQPSHRLRKWGYF